MVLAEKNNDIPTRNGKRSRGPSPNGHVVQESTSEDESGGNNLNILYINRNASILVEWRSVYRRVYYNL